MLLTLSQQKLNVIVCSGGCYRRMIFNPMPEERARELVRQYGYRPEEVCSLQPIEMPYKRDIDDIVVLEWLDQKRTYLQLAYSDIFAAIRAHIPNLLHIHGVRSFIAAYRQLVIQGSDPFIHPTPDSSDTPTKASRDTRSNGSRTSGRTRRSGSPAEAPDNTTPNGFRTNGRTLRRGTPAEVPDDTTPNGFRTNGRTQRRDVSVLNHKKTSKNK